LDEGFMESRLPKMSVEATVLSDVRRALKTEWLVTNGLGGYASSTILGMNTRKYHGLLVAAFNPPVDRHVLLSRLDEQIRLGSSSFKFGMSETTSGLHPSDAIAPSDFSLDPLPSCTYDVGNGGFRLKKTVFMPHEMNASIIMYEVANNLGETAQVSVSPWINCRGFHFVTDKEQLKWDIEQDGSGRLVTAKSSSNSVTLALFSTEAQFEVGAGEWSEDFYVAEAERGESSVDHNLKLGSLKLGFEPNETRQLSIVAVAGKDAAEAESILSNICKGSDTIKSLYESELKRRLALLQSFSKVHSDLDVSDWLKWLIISADSFIVKRESTRKKSVIAGYHWFSDWGRDTLISLPGLTLVLGRFEDARSIMQTFNSYCHEGLIPNVFPDNPQQTPAYNTVDATLWFVNAALQYLKYTNDFRFVNETLWPTLQSIIDHHLRGTMFGIHVDSDGLLAHGSQLTWMDAAPEGKPMTPREGKAVEIQALWYNALRIMQLLANRFNQDDRAEQYSTLAEKARKSFLSKFWHSQKSCLLDVISNAGSDDSLRPNQIFAASLDFTMLDKVKAELVVESVWKQLLTPFGFRTLSNKDSRYIGKYAGNRWQRDSAYHNGTVWPWLLGPFITAFLKLRGHDSHRRAKAFEDFLQPLFTVGLHQACLGSVSEVFDGDAPHEANGCISQAWSVAETLRAYVEDVLMRRPPHERRIMESVHG
jgi:predicted glycogen debranching enzyme